MTKKVCYNVTNPSPHSSMTHCRVRPEQKNPDTVFDWTRVGFLKNYNCIIPHICTQTFDILAKTLGSECILRNLGSVIIGYKVYSAVSL